MYSTKDREVACGGVSSSPTGVTPWQHVMNVSYRITHTACYASVDISMTFSQSGAFYIRIQGCEDIRVDRMRISLITRFQVPQ